MEDPAADAVFLQRGRYLLVAAQAEYGLVRHQQDGFEPKLPADAADLPTGSEALGHGGLWQGDLPDYLAGELPDDFSEFIKCHDKKTPLMFCVVCTRRGLPGLAASKSCACSIAQVRRRLNTENERSGGRVNPPAAGPGSRLQSQ